MNQEANHELLAKYFTGEADPSEQAIVKAWQKDNQQEFEKIELIWNAKKQKSFNSQKAVQKVWQTIEGKEAKVVPMKSRWRSVAAAAVILIGLGAAWMFFSNDGGFSKTPQFASVTNSDVAPKLVNLSDGSTVSLNQNSTLSYPISFAAESRKVKLEGEAFFEVAHNPAHPFMIDAGETTVTVLGTSFNVLTTESSTEVLVRTGKVQLAANEEAIILLPFEKGFYNASANEMTKKTNVDVSDLAWLTRSMIYEDVPIKEVIADMEKVFGTTIRLENAKIANCLYTGRLANLELKAMLELIQYTLDVENEKEGDNYLITGEGC